MRLEEIVVVKVGKNISRVNEHEAKTLETYGYENLMEDLNGYSFNVKPNSHHNHWVNDTNVHLSEVGDVVFSFMSSKAAIVSGENAGKLINQNFAKLMISCEDLVPTYLCYLLNESFVMKQQMKISKQGSTVRKLTPAILKGLEVKLPDLKKQQIIGRAYLTLTKRQALAKFQLDLEEKLYLEILNQLEEK